MKNFLAVIAFKLVDFFIFYITNDIFSPQSGSFRVAVHKWCSQDMFHPIRDLNLDSVNQAKTIASRSVPKQ